MTRGSSAAEIKSNIIQIVSMHSNITILTPVLDPVPEKTCKTPKKMCHVKISMALSHPDGAGETVVLHPRDSESC